MGKRQNRQVSRAWIERHIGPIPVDYVQQRLADDRAAVREWINRQADTEWMALKTGQIADLVTAESGRGVDGWTVRAVLRAKE